MLIFNAFGKQYQISDSAIKLSKVLEATYSGKFSKYDQEIDVDLDRDFLISFNFLMNFLNNTNISLPNLELEDLLNLLTLADYLYIPLLIQKISENFYKLNYNNTLTILLNFYHLPEIYENGISRINNFPNNYINLNSENKKYLESIKNNINSKPIFFKTLYSYQRKRETLQLSKTGKTFLNLMPKGWASKCQKYNRPEIIKDYSTIPKLISEGINFNLFTDQDGEKHYIRCQGNKTLKDIMINNGNLPCCVSGDSNPVIDKKYGNLKAVVVDNGWIVLTDKNFEGDYILIWKPIIFEDLQMIVDAKD